MLEVSGIRIPLSALDGSDARELAACRRAVARKLRVGEKDLATSSAGAARSTPAGAATCRSRSRCASSSWRSGGGAGASRPPLPRSVPTRTCASWTSAPSAFRSVSSVATHRARSSSAPGARGLFCALSLAAAGLEPLLVERGDDATRRCEIVRLHDETGGSTPRATSSLASAVRGPSPTASSRRAPRARPNRLILETFVAAGAQREILWDAKPHVGSDVLPRVVTDIVRQIEEAGGEVRCRCA